MRRGFRGAVLLAALAGVVAAAPARAQLSIYNLLQAQAGNVPFAQPGNRTDVYDQLNLIYGFEGGRVGLRFETDHNSEQQFGYRSVTQRWAEWSDRRARVRVGHLYTIVGRGIVHRSFELPGVVLDKTGFRSSYSPSRDLDGILVEGGAGPLAALAFAGKPNGGEFTPAVEALGVDRYRGQISGGQITASARGSRIGAGYTRSTTDGVRHEELATGFLELDPLALTGTRGVSLPLYFEYAQADGAFEDWWRFRTGESDRHALYASANLLWGLVTLSGEWKDYAGFRLGTNDPPSLVREHRWTLLNRNTHVLDASGERGHQVEGSVTWPGWGAVTLNTSGADGPASNPLRFREHYAELHVAPDRAPGVEGIVFFDQGQDRFVGIARRHLVGGELTVRAPLGVSVTLDAQRQRATRVPATTFDDALLAVGVGRSGLGSVGLQWERSTDPEQEDPDAALAPGIAPRTFIGGTLAARLSEHHDVTVFYGERRGGRACTAGTCYELLPFKGAELRLTSRF